MPTSLAAVLDACVLYPAPLHDLLMELAVNDLYRARWTAEIHDEWTRNLRADRPELGRALERTRELMDSHVRDALVTGHMPLVDSLALPDPGDRHVLAAAIRCDADLIVTKNLRDFPGPILDGYGIEAIHPDDFLVELLDSRERQVCSAVEAVRQRLKKPSRTITEYLSTLEQQGLIRTVDRPRHFADL